MYGDGDAFEFILRPDAVRLALDVTHIVPGWHVSSEVHLDKAIVTFSRKQP